MSYAYTMYKPRPIKINEVGMGSTLLTLDATLDGFGVVGENPNDWKLPLRYASAKPSAAPAITRYQPLFIAPLLPSRVQVRPTR